MCQKAVRVSVFHIPSKQIFQVTLQRVLYLLKQMCQVEGTIQTGLHPSPHLVGTLTMPGNLWLPGRTTLTLLTLSALATLSTYRQDDSYYGADS